MLAALYAWMLSWGNGYLYTFYTTHVHDNFRVIGAFIELLTSLRLDAVKSGAPDIAWTLAIFASAFALGRLAVDSLRIELGDWGRGLKALALGLGLLSVSLLILGLVGLWTKPVMMTLVLVLLATGLIRHSSEFLAWLKTRNVAAWNKEMTIWNILGFVLLAAYLLMNLMGALGPEYFYDSLVYHLAMPKLYLIGHRIVPTPNMIYSGVPFGTEMLYGLGLALGSESMAKLIHFGFGAAVAAAIYSWSKKHANRNAALLATLLFYSAPMTCFESTTALVELSMTFYLLIAAFIILEAAECESFERSAKSLIVAGALAGFAFGTKYNAGLYIPVLALPLLYRSVRAEKIEWGVLAKQMGFFFGAAAIVSSPWLLKNWFFYRDPVYPFLQGLFGGSPMANAAGLRADAHARDLLATVSTWPGVKDLFFGIWNLRSHNIADNVGHGLEIGLPWILLARWRSTTHRGLLILAAGIWSAWALHTTMPRFILPALPFLCILIAAAIALGEMPPMLRFLATGIVCYTVAILLAVDFMMLADPGTWKVAYGRMTKEQYLLHEHPAYNAPYYAGVRFINQNLPQDAEILFVGEERGFYCERKFITASWFNANPLAESAEAASSSADLALRLRSVGVTHLLVNIGSEHFGKWLNGLSPESRSKIEDLLHRDAKLIFDYNKQDAPNDRSWVQVYALPAAEGAKR